MDIDESKLGVEGAEGSVKDVQDLKNLSPEQIEEMKKKVGQMSPEELQEMVEKQCLFCGISRGEIEAVKVYEDDDFLVVLDVMPAASGHVIVMPKKHFQFMFQMPKGLVSRMFVLVSRVSVGVVNAVKAQGVNVFVAAGLAAGQRVPHVVVHLIPRFENDGLNLGWEGKKVEKGELEKVAKSVGELLEKELAKDADKGKTVKEEKAAKEEAEELLEVPQRVP